MADSPHFVLYIHMVLSASLLAFEEAGCWLLYCMLDIRGNTTAVLSRGTC
jgi:hypothetical protein